MISLRIDVTEWYPVHSVSEYGEPRGVPEDLARELERTEREFWAAQQAYRRYLAAVARDGEAYRHEPLYRRTRRIHECGRARPRRRPNPANS